MKNMGIAKKGMLAFIVFLMLLSFSFAKEAQSQGFNEGLTITYPQIDAIAQDSPYLFNFHVFNTSNGVFLTNATTTCYFQLYNDETGNHAITNNIPLSFSNNFDFYINVTSSNFSRIGFYSYNVQCNNTAKQGGFDFVQFQVTKSGKLPTLEEGLYFAILLIILVSFLFMLITGFFKLSESDQKSAGFPLEIEELKKANIRDSIRLFLFLLGYIVLASIFYISYQITELYLPLSILNTLFYAIWSVAYFASPFIVILIIVMIFLGVVRNKELVALADRGVMPQ